MPSPGRRAIEPDEQELVDRLADAVAAAYRARTPDVQALGEPVLVVVLSVYWDGADASHWGPPAYALGARAPERVPRGEDLWLAGIYPGTGRELGWPEAYADPVLREPGEALLALIEEREAYDLRDVFFHALTERLSAAWGVPVVWDDFEDGTATPPEDQARAQVDAATAAEWEALGLLPSKEPAATPGDALLVLPALPDGRVPGVTARGILTRDLRSSSSGPVVDDRVSVTGDDEAMVVGGRLPEGAIGVRVQDLYDVWHEATVAHGLWACALGHGARGGTPPVTFVDASGAPLAAPRADGDDENVVFLSLDDEDGLFDEDEDGDADAEEPFTPAWNARVVERAQVPLLWDDALGAAPQLSGLGGDDDAATSLELRDGMTAVEVVKGDWPLDDAEREARDWLEHLLMVRLGPRAAGRAALEAAVRPLPGTIEGRDETLLALSHGDLWLALWTDARARRSVRVQGTGGLPARLDLRRWTLD